MTEDETEVVSSAPPLMAKERRASLILVSFTYINLWGLKNICLGKGARDAPISDR